jgi:hypothetical protein
MKIELPENLARCKCGSHRLKRETSQDHAGPTDTCMDCGEAFPSKPGSITAAQHRLRMLPELPRFQSPQYRQAFGQAD